jgi:hypothetical protein
MAERLAQDYAGLDEPQADWAGQGGLAKALVERGLILPVLDGFDEIPRPLRGTALDLINAAFPLGQALVLSSRVEEYRDTSSPSAGVPVRLCGAAAVELEPLDDPDIAAYLRRDAGGDNTAAAARWDPVVSRLGGDDPVSQALSTPLMLFLARTVYNPRPGEHADVLPDPAYRCDQTRFPTRAAVERHLLDAFLPAAYRPHPRYPCRWSPTQAERAFVHLARHLEHDLGGVRADNPCHLC